MKNYIEMISEQDNQLVVDLIFKYPNQFFDPGDPSPLSKRELSNEAEKAITDAIYDRSPKTPVLYRIGFSEVSAITDLEKDLPKAVNNYFLHRIDGAMRDLRISRLTIKYGLIYGAVFITVLSFLGIIFLSNVKDFSTRTFISGIIAIACWVAIWGPVDVYLHKYLFDKSYIRTCRRVLDSTVRVEQVIAGPDGAPFLPEIS